jgi:2-haloacid dehalogenase
MPKSSTLEADTQGTTKALASLDFSRFDAITFDCYGTLVDWENGLLGAVRPILRRHGDNLSDEQILRIFGELEPPAQNPYRRYREVLAEVARGLGKRLGFEVSAAEADSLAESMKDWQPFPDTVAALEKLKGRFKLGIVSNVDDDLFAGSARHLKVKFDAVTTAEQAKAYKPSPAPFHLALKKFGLSANRVLHAGQSIYHDVLPAQSLGLATVLVYRRGFGATRPTEGTPDLRVPDMRTLAELALA